MKQISKKITFAGNEIPVVGNEIKTGDKAPNFTVLKADMSPLSLSDYEGKPVVISVAPSIDTPVCATQTAKFNSEVAGLGVDIIAVSCDLPFALGRFCAAEGIDKVVTVSDHKDLDFGAKYGFVLEPLRLLARGVVVIDKAGAVKHVEYVPEVTDEPNYEAAKEIIKTII